MVERVNKIAGHVVHGDEKIPDRPLVITIIGAGNSGHVCAGLFYENLGQKVKVQLLTSSPEEFMQNPTVRFPDGKIQTGMVHRVSKHPRDVIPNADVVLWTGPVNATKNVFESIRPYAKPVLYIGTIFAQGLMHLLASKVFGENVRFFALRNIPWLCRMLEKGKASEVVGPKSEIEVVTTSNISDDWIKTVLEPCFQVPGPNGTRIPVLNSTPDFTPIVFNPANQIIHPASYWSHWRNFTGKAFKEAPATWLYRDMGEEAGIMLQVLDEELQTLKTNYEKLTDAKGCKLVIPLKDRLLLQYGDQIADRSTLAKMVSTNKAYSMARTPFLKTEKGYFPNMSHRVVQDDIGWGLCVLLSIAEAMEPRGIQTPTTVMKMMVEWHQKLMGKEFLINGRLTGRDCHDLVLLGRTDALESVAHLRGLSEDLLNDIVEDERYDTEILKKNDMNIKNIENLQI